MEPATMQAPAATAAAVAAAAAVVGTTRSTPQGLAATTSPLQQQCSLGVGVCPQACRNTCRSSPMEAILLSCRPASSSSSHPHHSPLGCSGPVPISDRAVRCVATRRDTRASASMHTLSWHQLTGAPAPRRPTEPSCCTTQCARHVGGHPGSPPQAAAQLGHARCALQVGCGRVNQSPSHLRRAAPQASMSAGWCQEDWWMCHPSWVICLTMCCQPRFSLRHSQSRQPCTPEAGSSLTASCPKTTLSHV